MINKIYFFWMVVFSLFTTSIAFSQTIDLQSDIQKFLETKGATVGVAIRANDGTDTVYINADKHLPMQSVFKYHIAIVVLTQVDKGTFRLDQPITIKKEVLLPDTWSPLRDKYPEGATLPLSEIITYMVSQSDNIACDVLLDLLGGPAVVDRFYKENGIVDLAIKINEETMQSDWNLQFQNWTTARACNAVLLKYYENKQQELSAGSHNFLWKVMKGTETGAKRLKGALPSSVIVAHKTGYSGIKNGITEAAHDIGILFLAKGKPIFISVLVSHSKENLADNEAIIAHIAKLCYDHFSEAN